MDYQELIRLSTKGDKQALEDLFNLGDSLLADCKLDEASKVFRDSAISYRISAFRNSGLAQSANAEAKQLKEEIELFKRWIEANPNGLRKLPKIVAGISSDFILEELRDRIWPDEKYSALIPYLESVLEKNSMQFYSPGGSSLRRIIALLGDYFGLSSPSWPGFLDHLEVRIGMDQLADEVESRFLASKGRIKRPI